MSRRHRRRDDDRRPQPRRGPQALHGALPRRVDPVAEQAGVARVPRLADRDEEGNVPDGPRRQ